MEIQIKKYGEAILSFWKKWDVKKRRVFLGIVGGVAAACVGLGVWLNRPTYTVLYSGLSDKETAEVAAILQEQDTAYKESGGTISVLSSQEDSLRMELANQGYPKSTLNYDFFLNNVDIMSTDYEKKLIEKYQLNQRLESVIETLDCVQTASVTISVPETTQYAWDDSAEETSASVTVHQTAGQSIEAAQVSAIKQLVAKSVPNLTADNVAVIDTATGTELSADEQQNQVTVSQFKAAVEKEYEEDIRSKVLEVLTPLFGNGNVKVSAKSTMDVDKKVQEIITYIPSGDTNTGVVSESTRDTERNGTDQSGGAAGTESNMDTTYAGVTVDGDVIYAKDSETYKYLVSQTTEQIQSDAASLKDLTVAVVINKAVVSDEQKQALSALVANAASVGADKVFVYNSAFFGSEDETPAPVANSPSFGLMEYVLMGAAGLMVMLFFFVLLLAIRQRRKVKKLQQTLVDVTQQEEPAEMDIPGLGGDYAAEEDQVRPSIEELRAAQPDRVESIKKEIQEFSSQNPEIAAQLIRAWLRGDDNVG